MTPTLLRRTAFALALLLVGVAAPAAQDRQPAAVPNYWDPRERVALPDLSPRNRIRFLTTSDFPPFNFMDQSNRVSGFHVDLARAICGELGIVDKCQLQVLPWDELQTAMVSGQGDAIIAGLAVNADNRKDFLFTRPFLKLPARFIRRKSALPEAQGAESLAGRRVGVIDNSAHEALLRTYFPDIRPVVYNRADFLFDGLKSGEVDAVFGDGVRLSFWLGSDAAADCCGFFDGPYFAPAYLGEGLAIAVRRDSPDLALAFDHALHALSRDGTMKELYLRYFPNGLY